MKGVIPTLRAIVRDELRQRRGFALGIITQVFSNEGGSGDSHLAVNVRLRGSNLELQKVPVMVGRRGVSVLPMTDDLVVLGFVEQDLDGAIVIGFVYDESAAPPDAKADECVYHVPGDEDAALRRLHLELPNGNTLTVRDEEISVVMGGTTVTVEADGSIKLKAAGDVEVNADGDLSLKAGGAIKIEAGSDLKMSGASVTVEGQGEAKVKAPSVSLAGNTSFSPS